MVTATLVLAIGAVVFAIVALVQPGGGRNYAAWSCLLVSIAVLSILGVK